MAAVAAQTIANLWTQYQGTLGYLPALLDGSDTSAIIPMVEGLAYPLEMGLTNAVDRTGGPYAHAPGPVQSFGGDSGSGPVPGRHQRRMGHDQRQRLRKLSQHMAEKMYIAQHVAEKVLGLTGANVNGTVDQIHATIQVQNAPFQEWSDQTDGSGADRFPGRHPLSPWRHQRAMVAQRHQQSGLPGADFRTRRAQRPVGAGRQPPGSALVERGRAGGRVTISSERQSGRALHTSARRNHGRQFHRYRPGQRPHLIITS